jgi:hypothetical protein
MRQEFSCGWPICRAVITSSDFMAVGFLLACCTLPAEPRRANAAIPTWGRLSPRRHHRARSFSSMLSLQLADFGAEVIKVEDPDKGAWRVKGHSLFWKAYARNKKSITLDLRKARAKELLLALAERSQVLIENYRPGTLERSSRRALRASSSCGCQAGARGNGDANLRHRPVCRRSARASPAHLG